MAHSETMGEIIKSLVVNVTIAIVKLIVAVITGSGSLLAETMHSFADCSNQVLLLIGEHRAKRPPDASHPMGYGRDVYFWSFMVALLLFTGGGVFSIYEGFHKMRRPEPLDDVWMGFAILGFSIVLEGWSLWGNVKEMNRRRGTKPFLQYLQDTKDSDLVVIFGENAADVLGLAVSMIALSLAVLTGDNHWDGIGGMAVGAVLVSVAWFLAREVKSLLVGESADPELTETIKQIVIDHPDLDDVLEIITVQQGPGEVMIATKIRFAQRLNSLQICDAINEFERLLRARHPEAKWVFVEPDVEPPARPTAITIRTSGPPK